MAKKATSTNIIPMDDKPETATELLAPTAWREITETPTLKTFLSQKELSDYGQELARTIGEMDNLEAQKKSSADHYKSLISAKESRQGYLSQLIQDQWEEREIECKWHFECAGKTEDGNLIFHPEMKALIRIDNGEVVKTAQITDYDWNNNKELALENEGGENATDDEDEDEQDS